MNKKLYLFPLLGLGVWGLTACSAPSEKPKPEEGVSTVLQEMTSEVSVMPLEKRVFRNELISNGKVSAAAYSDLYFVSGERIARVYVQNGDRVNRGQKLAELDLFTLQNDLSQAANSLEKARLDLKDVLIGQGYSPDSLAAVPDDIMRSRLYAAAMPRVRPLMRKPGISWNALSSYRPMTEWWPIFSVKRTIRPRRERPSVG